MVVVIILYLLNASDYIAMQKNVPFYADKFTDFTDVKKKFDLFITLCVVNYILMMFASISYLSYWIEDFKLIAISLVNVSC